MTKASDSPNFSTTILIFLLAGLCIATFTSCSTVLNRSRSNLSSSTLKNNSHHFSTKRYSRYRTISVRNAIEPSFAMQNTSSGDQLKAKNSTANGREKDALTIAMETNMKVIGKLNDKWVVVEPIGWDEECGDPSVFDIRNLDEYWKMIEEENKERQ